MPAQPPPLAHIRAGVYELVLDVGRTSIGPSDGSGRPDALPRRVAVELTELCALSACVVVLVDGTGSVRSLIGSRPEAEQLTRLIHQLGAGPRGQRISEVDLLTRARTVVAEAAGKVGLPVTASIGLYGAAAAGPYGPSADQVGFLQLFAADPGALPAELLRALLPLADVLGVALHDAAAYEHSTQLVSDLSEALESQRPIEQAKGLLAQRHRIDLDAAYRLLRDEARRRNTEVAVIAAEIVARSWQAGSTGPDRASDDLASDGRSPVDGGPPGWGDARRADGTVPAERNGSRVGAERDGSTRDGGSGRDSGSGRDGGSERDGGGRDGGSGAEMPDPGTSPLPAQRGGRASRPGKPAPPVTGGLW